MTCEQIIKQGLIELLININGFDVELARAVREARADDSPEELLTLTRESLEANRRIAEALATITEGPKQR